MRQDERELERESDYYREKIICLLKQLNNSSMLERIYWFICRRLTD